MSLHLWPEQMPLIDVPEERPAIEITRCAPHEPPWEVAQSEDLHPSVTQPLPTIDGGWGTIMADPAWNFRSWVANANPTSDRSAERHYRTMTLDELAALPVKAIAAKNAHLFMWTTGPFLATAPRIARAWGFKFSSSGFVWMKLKRSAGKEQLQMISLAELPRFLHVGMGHTTRKNVEFCLLFRRGNASRLRKDVQEAIISPVREHSRKPDEAYERALRYAAGPYLELFSREERDGWTTWGNEVGKFGG
jgi:N6-adenosine-specific RNA methylase IME4